MKILIASQPKTGNVWIRNLLARLYALDDLNERYGDAIPGKAPDFVPWIREHGFPEGGIMHEHLYPKPELLEFARQEGVRLVTMLRNPYEVFVSFHHYVNRMPHIFEGRPAQVLIGKPIDHPDVLRFLASDYRIHLNISVQWVESDSTALVRYEELLADTPAELARLVRNWEPVSSEAIAEAVDHCSAEKMKKQGGWKASHIRSASARTWDDHLTEAHLEIFRENYSRHLIVMGYEVL
jgi:hypothetical protein